MEILNQLSSQKGDKTEDANKIVAEKCIANPKVLAEIAIGLEDKDKKLQSDCIEVFTLVAEVKPEFVVPYADSILHLLYSKETKTRWEAVHTLHCQKSYLFVPLIHHSIHLSYSNGLSVFRLTSKLSSPLTLSTTLSRLAHNNIFAFQLMTQINILSL